MAKAGDVERSVYQVEGFRITIRHPGGRDVRDDKMRFKKYPYERALKHSVNVAKWRKTRFEQHYAPGFTVDVLRCDGTRAHGRTLLATVRDTYLPDQ